MTGGGATGAVGSRGDGRRGHRGRGERLDQTGKHYRGGVIFTTQSKCDTSIKTPLLQFLKSMILNLLKKVKPLRCWRLFYLEM